MQTEAITQGSLQTREGRALPLDRTEVRASVTGAVAEVEVRQVFRNDTDAPIEAVYLFPLPHDASVYRMLFRIEDRVVQGVVKDKAEARRVYEKARSEGRAATLLEEDKPALFTLSVANVAPGVTIEVELGYQEVVGYDDGRWRFVFPMVAPERYRDASGALGGGLAPPRVATGERAPDVSVEVMVRGEGFTESLRCETHPTTTRHTDDGVPIVSLALGDALPNKDFVLTWQAGDTGVRPALRFERTEGQTGTFLLLVTPSVPKDLTERGGGRGDLKTVKCGNCGGAVTDLASIREIPGLGPVVPCSYCGAILSPGTEITTRATRLRDVLILVDRSASMRGAMPTVRQAVRTLLDALGPGDGAQLMAFDHDRLAFDNDGTRFAVVSPELLTMAERFLDSLAPRGGTELEAALERAATLPPRDGRTRVVVVLTDAAVGNEGRLLRRAPELLGVSTRLFVLGIGAAVDRRLVAQLARVGSGASDVVTLSDTPAAREETLRRFARRVREGGPVLTNLTMYWEGATMVDVYPKALPDLFGGEPLRVLGRFDHIGSTKLVLTGATADGRPFRQDLAVQLPARTTAAPSLTRLWARRRVDDLAARAGSEPTQAEALRAEATALSVAHSIVGPFTSLVAEDLTVSVKRRAVRKGVLQVVAGPEVKPPFVLGKVHCTVGRAAESDLQLVDARVSRKHLDITLEGDDWVARDLHSSNGIEVNGEMVRRLVLREGTVLTIGGTTLRFHRLVETFEVLPTARVDVPQMAPSQGDAPRQGAARSRREDTGAHAAMLDLESDADDAPAEFASMDVDGVSARAPLHEGRAEKRKARDAEEERYAGFAPAPAMAPASAMAPAPAMAPPRASAPAAAPAPYVPIPGPSSMTGGPGSMPGAPPPMGAPPMGAPPMMGGAAPGGPPPAYGPPPPSFGPPPSMMGYGGAPPPLGAPARASAPMSPPTSAMPPPAPQAPRGGFFARVVEAVTGKRPDEPPPPPVPPSAPPPFVPPSAPPPMPVPPAPVSAMPMPMLVNVPPPTNMPPPRPLGPPPAPVSDCPRCAGTNPLGARFCGTCGHDMAPPATPPPVVIAPPSPPVQPSAPRLAWESFLPASDPYPDAELAWFAARGRGALDLVFLVDETGSMGPYIHEVRTHLLALVNELRASPLCRLLRLGVVTYRDHPPQDNTYASRVVPLTDDIDAVHREVETLRARGGGDGPESVTDGLYDLVRLDWRPDAARAVVWFGDAPPHGVEPQGDAFPDGCPCGHHWYTQAESCREMGVTIYAIGCLPGLRAFQGAEAVFQKVAETSRGMYLPLRQASLLVPFIVGAASAELDRQRLDEHLADLITEAAPALAQTTESERIRWLGEALRTRGVRVRGMDFDPDVLRPAPMRFRPVTSDDVRGGLDRLRYQQRITV